MRDAFAANPQKVARVGLFSSTALIASNMVGAGAFTSLGLQLDAVQSPTAILLLWLLGGLMALCGAAVYGELGGMFPRSGGEYNFLSEIYHPIVGFLAGWLSATVGFAAPIALSAKAFGAYLARVVPQAPPTVAACGCIVVLAAVHARSLRHGAFVQNLLTLVSIGLVLLLIGAGLRVAAPQSLDWAMDGGAVGDVFSGPFAICLVYVSFAFSGWNASAYITAEIRNPKVNLPASLLLGTALVTTLYLLLNLTFLRTAPVEEMRGVLEVGHVSSTHIFGHAGSRLMSALISVSLLGSVSGMIFAGSRVPYAVCQDYRALPLLRWTSPDGAPSGSVAFLMAMALLLAVSGTFETILTFVGFTLSVCTCVTVAGVFLVRARKLHERAPYRCWGYPLTPILFLVLNLWMLSFVFWQSPLVCCLGLALMSTGIPVFFWLQRGHISRLEGRPETPGGNPILSRRTI